MNQKNKNYFSGLADDFIGQTKKNKNTISKDLHKNPLNG